MRPTRTDNTIAVALAVGLHVLLLVGILLSPTLRTPPAEGAPVVADLIDPRELSPALLRALEPLPAPTIPRREPEPLPVPELDLPARAIPDPAPVQDLAPEREAQRLRDELAAAEAEAERLRLDAEAEREAERLRQEQDAERQRREDAERRRRETQQQLERIRNERARAEREERQAEERLRDLERRRSERPEPAPAPPTASPPAGVAGGDTSLRAQWISAMVTKIEREWIRPDSIRPGTICPIRIRILAGGEVRSAEIQPQCPYDDAAKRSVEAAVLKASPLPWAGYESVAVRDVVVNFRPSSRQG